MPSTMTLDQLAPTFTGQLLQPTDAGDDEARRVHARRRSQRRWTRNDRWRSDDRSRTDEGHSRRPGQAHQLATTSPSELQRTQQPLRRPKLLPLQVRIVCAIYLAHAPVSALTKSSRLSAPGRSPDTDVSPRRLSSLQAAVRNRARRVGGSSRTKPFFSRTRREALCSGWQSADKRTTPVLLATSITAANASVA